MPKRIYQPKVAGRRAFTVIELLVVIGIIALLAGISVPALKGMKNSNVLGAAARQLIDDLGFARLKAINDRTTIYVVFVPPQIVSQNWTALDLNEKKQLTNAISGQYTSYALFSKRSLGDQPGPGTLRYLTDWKALPEGIYISTNKFDKAVSQVEWGKNTNPTNRPLPYLAVPFPTATSAPVELPVIAFNYKGQLLFPGDEFIFLTRGSAVFKKDTSGRSALALPALLESPKNNTTNNPYVRID